MTTMSDDGEHLHGYSIDTEDQPQSTGDSTADDRGLPEPLDEGYSPPERWSTAQGFGNTEWEADQGDSLDHRLAQEVPDSPAPAVGEMVGGEVGTARAGRLVEDDEGARTDTDPELYATDVGIDGAGASAEEAAMHVIDDPDFADPDEGTPS
ncbi:MAG: DUF5709 domain-containing protein [Sporichthyaceae bacterium]